MNFNRSRNGKPPGSRKPNVNSRDNGGSYPPAGDSNQNKKPCFQFQEGKCTYGTKCKYAHVAGKPGSQSRGPTGNPSARGGRGGDRGGHGPRPGRDPVESKLQQVTAMMRGPTFSGREAERFLTLAMEVLETGVPGIRQKFVQELADEDGLQRIVFFMQANYSMTSSQLTEMTFWFHCVPFLKIIAHEELSSTLLMEKAVGTMYNIVYGHSGVRAIPFFRTVANHLSTSTKYSRTSAEFGGALVATVRAILMTVKSNQGAAVQAELSNIAKTVRGCIPSGSTDHAARLADTEMRKVEQRLGVAELIPETSQPVRKSTNLNLTFPNDVDLPGHRSSNGPRHDNDKALITEIRILPTHGEITSMMRPEYLPKRRYDNRAHHLRPGIERILDTQFRLLREDTSGQLRDAIRYVTSALARNPNQDVRRHDGTPTLVYKNVILENFRAGDRDALQLDVSFDQPQKIKSKNLDERKKFWEASKNLQNGALLCLVQQDNFTFVQVSERSAGEDANRRGKAKDGNEEDRTRTPRNLVADPHRAFVALKLVDVSNDLRTVVKAYHHQRRNYTRQDYVLPYLIEFSGMLFASFEPILRFLQDMLASGGVPFSRLIAPEGNGGNDQPTADPANPTQVLVPPPLYLTKRNISLDLSVILKKDAQNITLSHSIARPCSIAQLQANTTLDLGQCEALIGGLSRELALIQGPPGTGKSYVGLQLCKILLHNNQKLRLGPIVCVCYTNHALDQFLVELLDSGVEKLVRLGSRSKEPKLENFALRIVAKQEESTWMERAAIRHSKDELEQTQEEIGQLCNDLSKAQHWATLKNYLEVRQPMIFRQLFSTKFDDEGFELVSHRKPEQVIEDWISLRFLPLANSSANIRRVQTIEELRECTDMSVLSLNDRVRLKGHWESEIKRELLGKLRRAMEQFKKDQEQLQLTYHERDLRCLHGAQVIGVTTTGLAGHATLLRKLVAKVMLCEEAGEVLEAHTLMAILPSVEHAILIGDHQQLRPHISNFSLSLESWQGGDYALDESLFERLTKETYGADSSLRLPFATLDTQRRMHPSISNLIRQTLYPELKDHVDTSKHPQVNGMARRLFWMNHDHMEANADKSDPMSVSKFNNFEIDMVAALVKHLIKQGKYGKGDIAVITPYLGQMMKMRKKFMGMFEILVGERDQAEIDLLDDSDEEVDGGVVIPAKPPKKQEVRKGDLLRELRLATVDNFQGEEAKVIVISLVRANPGRRCGFLKTPNRINVLLSRAKHGMYIIGNADTARPVQMWSDILTLLNREGDLGDELELSCPRHKDKKIFVSKPDDFLRFAPEGGCDERCGKRLEACGHTCTNKCHSDMLHRAVECTEECIRKLPGCDHSCPIPCGQNCRPCRVIIPEVPLPCGHTSLNVFCHEAQKPQSIRCSRSVIKTVPGCGHQRSVACHLDVTLPWFKCPSQCGENLPCGHKCLAQCHECRKPAVPWTGDSKHVQCRSICQRDFNTCGHSCSKVCHVGTECGVCVKPCEIRCAHSKCTKKCSDACTPCAEQCTWGCVHREKCNMPCAVPCDILPCSKRCEQQLPCEHQCPSVCGERCPDVKFCQQCASPEILDTVVDMVCLETYKEIELDSDPVIFLSCGHFFCMNTVDGLMRMKDVYEYDKEDNIVSQKPQGDWITEIKPTQIRCPTCRGPLTDIMRYNRVAKGIFIEVLTQRFLVMAHQGFLALEQQVSDIERALDDARKVLATVMRDRNPDLHPISSFMDARHSAVHAVSRRVAVYITSVTKEEQPYCRINALVADCLRRNRITNTTYTVDDASVVLRNRLLGQALFLRAHWARLYDLLEIHELSTMEAEKMWIASRILRPLEKMKAGCKQLERAAVAALEPQQQVEAKLYHARFVGLGLKFPHKAPLRPAPEIFSITSVEPGESFVAARRLFDEEQERKQREYREQIQSHEAEISSTRKDETESLEEALAICDAHPVSTRGLKSQVEEAMKLVKDSVFYSPMTTEEQRAVYDAMRQELKGTGHWYYCVNRHPFTIGECGMPMEEARCPQCDAPIGGRNHTAVAGVERANDLDTRFAGMGI